MVLGLEAETTQVYEEVRGAIASVVSQIGNIIRQILDFFMKLLRQFYTYVAENPLNALLLVTNVVVWIS